MNETYQEYINRVAQLTLPGTCSSQLQTIQTSPKFIDGKVVPFPGYSVITPPNKDDADNQKFYSQIQLIQQSIIQQLEPGFVIPLTPESFHFTIADLVWDHSYQQAVQENPQFETQLREQINQSFQQYQTTTNDRNPIQWQLLGITIRPRAIVACLAPKDQASYQTILDLRRCIYQNAGLIALGIEQQYDFTAHITLGYFGPINASLNRSEVCVIISQISDRLLEGEPTLITVKRGELRKFDDMLNYHRQPDWAAISF
ncbi:conserved hypothetical protein [Hyella patelloides LEGE 07179]|uniref:DUF1868 domain-containing protein n=1 Tax=Hyella patelloides LEGE 07179 TaxID=945734 RepID=A0A563VX30_9CYAN|nr:DUF1868 domain-containing protein [Hyella patelloides]VEP15823.1 conserved hypothetical protein [Hyella patelloides LEGE 07179]